MYYSSVLETWQAANEYNKGVLLDLRQDWGNGKDSVLVGLDRADDPVFVDFGNLDRFLGVTIAPQGAGKSVFAAWLNWYFRLVFDAPSLIFDRSDEFKTHKKPVGDKRAKQKLGELGLKPQGLGDSFFRLRPKCVPGPCDATFSLNLPDLQAFGVESYEYLLSSALDARHDSPAQRRAISFMCQQGCLDMEALTRAWKAFKQGLKDEGEAQSAGMLTVNLDALSTRHVFDKGGAYDFKASLNARHSLALLGSFQGAGSGMSSRLLSFHASYLTTALYDWRLKNEVPSAFILREETPQMAGFPEGAAVISREVNLERKAGNHYLYSGIQNLVMMPPDLQRILLDTCIVFTTKISASHFENIADSKMLGDSAQRALQSLDYSGRPYEWLVIDTRGETRVFRPLPPLSQWYEKIG